MAVFDKEANSYDEWYKTKMGSYVDEVETRCVFDLFKVKEGMKILDIGCGTGNFSIKLAKMGCEVVAIDISNEMLKVAKSKAKKENLDIEFHNMNVYDLKFEDEYFDGVLSITAFEFVNNPKRAMIEIFRVLKPSGKLIIGVINKDSKWGEMYLSKKFQDDSVFKYADLKKAGDLKGLKENNLVDTRECLFIPPYTDEKNISLDKELELSKEERGGFICALWEK
ncbi:class I SAM-dependent methyltransferase [Schnuerera sp. xch1]|uniref:class I SAM-dependent methyltransferase n=1 Tax=Schnuerera sp. xch1 TaxID=2874283 RepID=UPI001CBDAACF|nr:class I SAM-dependent methyltransferase [Schnuerera sp. xch1]MBZ2174549.1 class I SAM-dependent methyltransferase [Schnuerera sp. xch1]